MTVSIAYEMALFLAGFMLAFAYAGIFAVAGILYAAHKDWTIKTSQEEVLDE